MIPVEFRGRALAITASLALHAAALLALEAREADPHFAAPAREVVVEVTMWSGDDGRTAPAPASNQPPDAPAASTTTASAEIPSVVEAPPAVSELDTPAEPNRTTVADEEPTAAPSAVALSVERTERQSPASAAERPEQPLERTVPAPEPSMPIASQPASASEQAPPALAKAPPAPPHAPTPPVTAANRVDHPTAQQHRPQPLRKPGQAQVDASKTRRAPKPDASATTGSVDDRGTAAKPLAGGRPGPPGPQGNAGSTSELAAYLARVRARIASHQAAYGGEQGRVGIRFDVAGDGNFTALAVVSGDRGPMADAALRVVRRASPAPPIPPALGRSTIPVSVTIAFE